MFEVVVSDRFAAWYEGLPEREAEEVTLAGVRLLEVLGAIERAPRTPLGAAERWLLDLILLERERAPGLGGKAWVQHQAAASEGPGPLQLAVLEALRLVGLSPRAVFDAASGLREITVDVEGWHARLIVGADVGRERLIAILGEPLDRDYYGDSVKFAEAFFRDYMARQEKGTAATP